MDVTLLRKLARKSVISNFKWYTRLIIVLIFTIIIYNIPLFKENYMWFIWIYGTQNIAIYVFKVVFPFCALAKTVNMLNADLMNKG